ncbi:MAG: metal ABC transporter permease [Planctomycetes bacterium]|nr:metal ABC transporter permease [Planctomycetota bacterium]
MLLAISGYFTEPWMLAILLAVVCVNLSAGLLSPYVVANRMAFFSDAVAHSTLAGIALGMLFGLGEPTLMMVGFALLVGLTIAYIRQHSTISLDALLGVAMAGALAAGVIMYSKAKQATDLHGYLFGNVAFITWSDTAVLAGVAAFVLLVVLAAGNKFALIAVSRNLALSRGVKVALYEYILILVLALVVAVSVRAVGLLLVNALLVVPAATARNFTRSFRGMVWGSLVVSLLSGVVGLFSAGWLGWPEGPTIVVVAVVMFGISNIVVRTSSLSQ